MSDTTRAATPRSYRSAAFGLAVSAVLVGGVLWGLCFGAHSRALLSCIALGPLLWCAGGVPEAHSFGLPELGFFRRGLLGLIFGFASWCVAIPWIAGTVSTFGAASPALGFLALLLLSLYLGLYQALFAALGPLVAARPLGAVLGLPALWVALEWLRAYLLTGFPWNLAAHAWIDVPGALPASAWIGGYGVSFLVVATNLALLRAALRRSAAPLVLPLSILTLLLAAWWQVPSAGLGGAVQSATEPAVAVRLVQPNTNIFLDPSNDDIIEGLERLFRLSACRPGELLVWPESAAWPYSYDRDAGFRRRVAELTQGGCGLLLNSARPEDDRFYNAALLVEGGSVVAAYDKNQLVPFGEYVPLGSMLPFVRQIARIEKGFSAGRRLELLPWGSDSLGVAMCFEIIFADQVAARVRGGASILVTLTNDAWYGDTSAPWQHLAAARFRAAENRRPVIRAAITGISAIIDRFGRIEQRIGIGEEGVLDARVHGRRALTVYTRAPWLFPGLCVLAVVAALINFVLVVRRRS